jgi:HNH endonuclease
MLSQEEVRSLFDYREGRMYWRVSLCRNRIKAGTEAGTICLGYWKIMFRRKCYFRSNLVWVYFNGEIPGRMEIDHWDRNTLNDYLENLRLGTKRQNNYNRAVAKRSISGFKGVCPCPWKPDHWRVGIFVKGKTIRLGIFKDKIEAARVYDRAARQYFGEFAYLNFP